MRNKGVLPITSLDSGDSETPEVLGVVFGKTLAMLRKLRVVLTT